MKGTTSTKAVLRWGPSIFLLVMSLGSTSWAQSAPPCSGPNLEHHSYGNFDFETNSRADKMQFRQYGFGLISCVSNNDSANPLFARWLIPGPRGWVPPKAKLESTPRLIAKNAKFLQLKGCLLYGNRGDTTRANFLGIEEDKKAVDDENVRGCQGAAAGGSAEEKGITLENIILKVKNFFPSDSKNPQGTMLRLEGEVGIKTISSDQYVSYFTYVVSPYNRDSKGIVEKLNLRPLFRGQTESLLQSFFKQNSDNIKMTEKGYVQFAVSSIKTPELRYGSYVIYDQNSQAVAAIDLPVFVSSTNK